MTPPATSFGDSGLQSTLTAEFLCSEVSYHGVAVRAAEPGALGGTRHMPNPKREFRQAAWAAAIGAVVIGILLGANAFSKRRARAETIAREQAAKDARVASSNAALQRLRSLAVKADSSSIAAACREVEQLDRTLLVPDVVIRCRDAHATVAETKARAALTSEAREELLAAKLLGLDIERADAIEKRIRRHEESVREKQAATQKAAAARAAAAQKKQLRRLTADLHRNLDGAGGGFVKRWRIRSDSFVLVVDSRKYVPNSAIAAAMTARALFETNGVRLPSRLVFEDTDGSVLDSGPFANVPSLTE